MVLGRFRSFHVLVTTPQFPRSQPGRPGSMVHHLVTTEEKKRETPAFLESRSAKARSTEEGTVNSPDL